MARRAQLMGKMIELSDLMPLFSSDDAGVIIDHCTPMWNDMLRKWRAAGKTKETRPSLTRVFLHAWY